MLVGCLSIETFKNPTQICQEKKAGDTEGRNWYDSSHNCKVPGIDFFLSEGEVQKLCWHSVLDWASSEFSAFTSLCAVISTSMPEKGRVQWKPENRVLLALAGPTQDTRPTVNQWPQHGPCTCPHLQSLGLRMCWGVEEEPPQSQSRVWLLARRGSGCWVTKHKNVL